MGLNWEVDQAGNLIEAGSILGSGIHTFTWDPNYAGPFNPNILLTWTDVYNACIDIPGIPKRILLNQEGSPYTIPPGSYDMTDITFYSPINELDLNSVAVNSPFIKLTISDGVTLPNLLAFDGPILIEYQGTTVPCVTANILEGTFSLENNANLYCSGTQPYLEIVAGVNIFIVSSSGGVILASASGTVSPLKVTSPATLGIAIADRGHLEDDTISGNGSLDIFRASSNGVISIPYNFPSYTGTPINLFDSSQTPIIILKTVDPTITDDVTLGYVVGQLWINTTTNGWFISSNVSTGAAVWTGFPGGGTLNLSKIYDSNNLLAIDVDGRQLVTTSGDVPFDWEARLLKTAANNTIMSWGSGLVLIFSTNGTISANFDNRILKDSSGNDSIDWTTRIARDSSAGIAIDWDQRNLKDSSGNVVVDWGSYVLRDTAFAQSVEWNNRNLVDSSGSNSITWQTRQLVDTGAIGAVDWQGKSLTDSSGSISYNWDNRTTYHTTGNIVIDALNLVLNDAAANLSLNWVLRQTTDSLGALAIDWDNRHLIAKDGTTVNVDWSNTGEVLFGNVELGNIGSLTIGGTLPSSTIFNVTSTTAASIPAPLMTSVQRLAITPSAGMQVYDTTLNQFMGYNGTLWVVLG